MEYEYPNFLIKWDDAEKHVSISKRNDPTFTMAYNNIKQKYSKAKKLFLDSVKLGLIDNDTFFREMIELLNEAGLRMHVFSSD